ncbi:MULTISPECIES: hypothetical protein [unclassified Streptomyces]|uniref:hypothetical protein n=1 Tax=unclassified Streptomyces TaxID=2593676 RepID=UPI00224EF4A6|nr:MULTISPECIES: hypothetical protein [unclassified Streptomyces]MCX4528272.1 hypothetical protein [Streptomyces sp. NBC_01551]MCX4541128.1 hypothetical protein [Streptomyces sp. NBC_01565]
MDTTKTSAPPAPEADSAEPQTPARAEKADGSKPAATKADTTKAEADVNTAATEAATEAAAEAPAGLTGEAADLSGADDLDDLDDLDGLDEPEQQVGGVGAAASAIVAAGLGLVALSGTWVSRVIAERQTLIGQIESVNATTTEAKISALYGDAWHLTALVNGVVSTLALLLAVFVLARPAFGTPGRVLPVWIRSVAWAAVALGAIGVLLFGLMYFDLLLAMPKAAA